jgi:pimeloyl-ACP methyl ester carboxylesterase
MVSGLLAEEERNLARIPSLAQLDIPVQIIWGDRDPYLRTSYARYLQGKFKTAELHVVNAGHWVQLDEAPTVDIFFDDQEKHVLGAAAVVAAGHVPGPHDPNAPVIPAG